MTDPNPLGDLVLEALNIATWQRTPQSVIHHSDQGCQYTSLQFGKRYCCLSHLTHDSTPCNEDTLLLFTGAILPGNGLECIASPILGLSRNPEAPNIVAVIPGQSSLFAALAV